MDKKYQLRWNGLDGGPRLKTCETLAEAIEFRTTIGKDWAAFTEQTPVFSIWEVTAVKLEGI